MRKGSGGPKTPLCEGKGPENDRRRGANCCCGLSWQPRRTTLRVVLPSSGTIWVDVQALRPCYASPIDGASLPGLLFTVDFGAGTAS